MTKNKLTEQQKIFLLIDTESDADYLPPPHEPTEEEQRILAILEQDEQQRRWEAEARRAGLI